MIAVFKYQKRKNNLKQRTTLAQEETVNWPTVILGRKSEVSMATNE